MSTYNISMLSGNVLEVVQNLNIMSGGWLGLFIVYIPPVIALLKSLKDTDDIPESILVSLALCFGTTIIARVMELVGDYFTLINLLLLALIGGYLYYRNR